MFKFLKFEIQNFQTTSDGEAIKTKVVVLNDIYNFAVKTFSIGILLGFRILISKSGKVNMRGILCPLVIGDFGWSGQGLRLSSGGLPRFFFSIFLSDL
jgi:hypothetical protein